jgi:DNA polymerase (family X)
MLNEKVANILYEIADLLELKDEKFKPQAYRKAAHSIETMETDIQVEYEHGRLRDIPGVGDAIEGKIAEIIKTGELRYLEDLKAEFPPGLIQVMEVQEIGPKTTVRLYRELKITNLQDLKLAAEQHRIRGLKGFGEKTEENILKGIRYAEESRGRMLLAYAHPIAAGMVSYMRMKGGFDLVDFAGSLRRKRETIGDLDILVATDDPEKAMDAFVAYPEVDSVLVRGKTKTSVRLRSGTQVDLRVVSPSSYGAALQYFTGSKEHNVVLRSLAIEKGLKLNEYGLVKKEGGEVVASRTEEDIYRAMGMTIMPPEIRENRGEIEAALKGQLPRLVDLPDIKGDLHMHTSFSDGADTMEAMAKAGMARGYQYIGITDHSVSLRIANGLDEARLQNSIAEARRLSESMAPFQVLIGAEVEVDEKGELDYPNAILAELDYVVAAVHSRFKMGEAEMTERILTAMSNEHVRILAHPTGRILGQREGYVFDTAQVFQAAMDSSVCLEVNAFPDRLDLGDKMCRSAREAGVMLVIDTDAHNTEHLDNMQYGVAMARRGWVGPELVMNTRDLKAIRDWMGR